MENNKPTTKPLYFSNIHKRVQNKYEEMQKKIKHSKSLDSLQTLLEPNKGNEIYTTVKAHDEKERFDEQKDLQRSRSTMSLEDVKFQDILFQDIDIFVKEEFFYESSEINGGSDEIKLVENAELNDLSLKVTDDPQIAQTHKASPPKSPKLSIRQRINQKILESKEKRKNKAIGKVKEVKNTVAVETRVKENRERVEKFILSNTKEEIPFGRLSKRMKVATVTIALIEAKGLEDSEEKAYKNLNCRFKFGSEKCKSKSIKYKDKKFAWMELFNMNMYEEYLMEISLWERENMLGRNSLDLSILEKEKSHKMSVTLNELPGVEIFLMLTITGLTLAITDTEETEKRNLSSLISPVSTIQERKGTVGSLTVTVFGAKGLNHTDCYCLLELDNERVQTHTENKNENPNWMKTFEFAVNDITSILEITIRNEKRDDDIGKISISLLKINNGEKRWYALKDNTLRERAKGDNPRILLEMNVSWDLVKASIRVIHPKELKYLQPHQKVDRHVLSSNIARIKACAAWCYDICILVKTCFEWESRLLNISALSLWLVFVWFFRIWMAPLLLLIPFAWYVPPEYKLINWRKSEPSKELKPADEKTSLIRKIQTLQDMILVVQEAIGTLASYGESIKNLFNFTVPYLSCLAIFFISVIALVMFLVPLRYIIITWSLHKFIRKIIRPNRVANNEIVDLLSRVPDDETLMDLEYLEIEEEDNSEIEKNR